MHEELDSYPGPLGQVLVNLINNALLHAFHAREQGCIELRGQTLPGDWLELQVCDDSIGIADEHLPRIFDPFFTTRLGQGGSGLGLHIVHNLVSGVLGGKLSVRSQLGQGTCFTLRLPRVAPLTSSSPPDHYVVSESRVDFQVHAEFDDAAIERVVGILGVGTAQ